MLRNFFVVAYRNILRSKGFSIINISGLSIGMASALLILLWIQNELSYDSFYANSDRLYQCWNRDRGSDGINCWNVTPKPLGPGLKQQYPEIEKATRVNWNQTLLMTVGEKKINISGTMVDPDFLTMFNFPFAKGDLHTALNNPEDIVITQKLARNFFGNDDAIGKVINIDNKYNHTVSAVLKDLPNNTHFDFEFLLPWSYLRKTNQDDSSWGNNSTQNFVLLKPATNIATLNTKIQNIIITHGDAGWTTKSFLYPLSKLRLYSSFD